METSFIKKRRDPKYQTRPLKVDEELAKVQPRVEICKNESKIRQNRKSKPSTQMMLIPTKEYPLQKTLMK